MQLSVADKANILSILTGASHTFAMSLVHIPNALDIIRGNIIDARFNLDILSKLVQGAAPEVEAGSPQALRFTEKDRTALLSVISQVREVLTRATDHCMVDKGKVVGALNSLLLQESAIQQYEVADLVAVADAVEVVSPATRLCIQWFTGFRHCTDGDNASNEITVSINSLCENLFPLAIRGTITHADAVRILSGLLSSVVDVDPVTAPFGAIHQEYEGLGPIAALYESLLGDSLKDIDFLVVAESLLTELWKNKQLSEADTIKSNQE